MALIYPKTGATSSAMEDARAAAESSSADALGPFYAATPTASDPAIKPVWTLDQIVTNFERNHTVWAAGQTVAYSFETSAPMGEPSAVGFGQLTDVEKTFTRAAFQLISDVANIQFIEVAAPGVFGRASGTISYQLDSKAPSYEWGDTQTFTRGFSGGYSVLAAAQVDLSPTAVSQRLWFFGGYNFMALIHETLHALGFPHPGDYNADASSTITYANSAEYAQDSRQYTVLSYFDPTSTGANFKAQPRSWMMWRLCRRSTAPIPQPV
jgi:hypothetical protein